MAHIYLYIMFFLFFCFVFLFFFVFFYFFCVFDVYCPLIVFPSIDNCVIYYYRLMYTKLPQQEPDIVFCTAELGINTPIVDSKNV